MKIHKTKAQISYVILLLTITNISFYVA